MSKTPYIAISFLKTCLQLHTVLCVGTAFILAVSVMTVYVLSIVHRIATDDVAADH